MTEIGIGVLFAAMFVMAYVLVLKLLGPRKERLAIWRYWTQPTFDAAQLAGEKKPHLFLTTEALSQHHSQASSRKATGQQRTVSGTERR